MKKDRSSEDNLGVSTGKKRRSIYARGQDEQEDEGIISEEGSRWISSTRSAMEEWCAKHDIGRFVGYNRKQKVNLGAIFHSVCNSADQV